MKRNGVLVGVLFAGPWKTNVTRRAKKHARRLASLPEWKDSHCAGLPGLLNLLSAGLIAESERICKMDAPPATRKAAILRFIQLNFSRAVKLADLAKALSLSSSRTGHLVGELFGKSFPAMLRAERMKRAASLLISTDFSVKEIAQLVGIPNEYHFSRTFHAYARRPPGRFRQSRTPLFPR